MQVECAREELELPDVSEPLPASRRSTLEYLTPGVYRPNCGYYLFRYLYHLRADPCMCTRAHLRVSCSCARGEHACVGAGASCVREKPCELVLSAPYAEGCGLPAGSALPNRRRSGRRCLPARAPPAAPRLPHRIGPSARIGVPRTAVSARASAPRRVAAAHRFGWAGRRCCRVVRHRRVMCTGRFYAVGLGVGGWG